MVGTEEQEKQTREARLLVSSPEAAYRELKIYGANVARDIVAGDEALENSLLAREDPLIDLGLACYGTNEEVVGALYRKGLVEPRTSLDGRYRKGLRIACLSNQVIDNWAFPTNVIGKEETHRVLFEADRQEADALLCNPKLNDDLLVALYQRSEPLAALPDDRWCDLISMSAKNPRLVTRNDTEDGPDLGHRSIQRAVFGLLRTAPTTPEGLRMLYRLLYSLDPQLVPWPERIDTELGR
jgi:hypothetical protein